MFYQISPSLEKKYCYAYQDLTLKGLTYGRCPYCSRTIGSYDFTGETHQFLLEGGTILPDLLGFHGAGTNNLIISSRALQVFRTNDVSGFNDEAPVSILHPFSNMHGNNESTEKQYFIIQTFGHIDLNLSAMQLKKKRKCLHCGQFDWNRRQFHPMHLDITTWDGSDLCQLSSIPGYKICSEKVIGLVKQHKLTGFSFVQVNAK